MKWLLIMVVIFSLITIFELHKEHKKNKISNKIFTIIVAIESVATAISIIFLLIMEWNRKLPKY